MPVKFWLTIVRFWFFLNYLITTVWATFEGVFLCFRGKKNFFWEHYSVCTKNLHNTLFIKIKKKKIWPKNMKKLFFLWLRRFSNLNVLHTGLLMQDWVFRLGIPWSHHKPTLFWLIKCCRFCHSYPKNNGSN